MPWSTTELATLAGTTVNTIRHYHRLGLLEHPERRSNGYKSYEATHLLRLLQIRRLRDIGVPLDRIEQVASDERPPETLRAIDAGLDIQIQRLQRMRSDISVILKGDFAAWLPLQFEDVADRLSSAEKAAILLSTTLYDSRALADMRQMLLDEPDHSDGASEEFDALPPDADEATRVRLAVRFAPELALVFRQYPWLTDPSERVSVPLDAAQAAMAEAMVALYNPAQRDVMARAIEIARADSRAATQD
ncbi:MerR family transcriptional regulator [Microbacterium paludicola]|uniref:MerR family transcriptional regulator n=2 Tax=Microbacterium paludicola TaxID=300019 RepID=A0A4Y9FXA7_9MICO|nr:MerR family transcriptional regulator [Microbacterium paludicola]TFU33860.1 MerR family transcriptional regulator [Microbacterium paludicola]